VVFRNYWFLICLAEKYLKIKTNKKPTNKNKIHAYRQTHTRAAKLFG
jgi:hypothetical protein